MATREMITLWFPRLLCIAAILFVSMFALDAFEPGMPFIQQLGGFLLHLIPSFILLLLLFVAWKRKLLGGILFILIGVGLSPFVYLLNYNRTHAVWVSFSIILMITFPFIVSGILFIMSHYQIKKNN